MSKTSGLVSRVEALERAVQSVIGAVNLLEELFEKNGFLGKQAASKKPQGAVRKKRAPVKKRVSKK